jgi:hypothetical protein
MDGSKPTSISAQDLYSSIGTAIAPVIIDVRRGAAFAVDNRMIVGAIRRNPEEVDALYAWCRDCHGQGHDWNPAAMMSAKV